MFRELSEPDFYDVSAQLELFVWRKRAANRERERERWRTIRVSRERREAHNAYKRVKTSALRKRKRRTDPIWLAAERAKTRARMARLREQRRAA